MPKTQRGAFASLFPSPEERAARLILLALAAAAQIGGSILIVVSLGWRAYFGIALFAWGYYLQVKNTDA
jgi:hypothetical protein